jgi:hypothetical protein
MRVPPPVPIRGRDPTVVERVVGPGQHADQLRGKCRAGAIRAEAIDVGLRTWHTVMSTRRERGCVGPKHFPYARRAVSLRNPIAYRAWSPLHSITNDDCWDDELVPRMSRKPNPNKLFGLYGCIAQCRNTIRPTLAMTAKVRQRTLKVIRALLDKRQLQVQCPMATRMEGRYEVTRRARWTGNRRSRGTACPGPTDQPGDRQRTTDDRFRR